MIYLIYNEYVNQNFVNYELRNDKLETLIIKTNDALYNIGDFVVLETLNGKNAIEKKVDQPLEYLDFFEKGKVPKIELESKLSDYVSKIKNEKYRSIIQELIFVDNAFFLYPAAKSIHHAYIGGLCEHTLNILELSEVYAQKYNLDQDLLFAGAILHDYGKIKELKEYGLTYSVTGNLLGHITICVEEISYVAKTLGINDDLEIVKLKHLILSHHGKLEYGSPKEPMLLEAYVLSQLDEVDAKIDLLTNVLKKSEKDKLTPPISAMDRRRFIKV